MTTTATWSATGVDALEQLVLSTGEYALIDVREPASIARDGSIFAAVSLPLGRLELEIDSVVPRREVPMVVVDGGNEGLAERAARRLNEFGYDRVSVLEGGVAAWADAGHTIYRGSLSVVGVAFSELVAKRSGLPYIDVAEYQKRVARGDDMLLIDTRPLSEFEARTLPGSVSVPGAEIVWRVPSLLTSPETLVVVHCAGRVRSHFGAQALINAGIPNPVVALEGGAMAWLLAGFDLEHGARRTAPTPTGAALDAARAGAERLAAEFAVAYVGTDEIAEFNRDRNRSLYLFDVRSPGEYAEGHVPGSRSAPSWEIVPGFYRFASVHNARIALIDDDTIRATLVASWLLQMGVGEVVVWRGALNDIALDQGVEVRSVVGLDETRQGSIDAATLTAWRTEGWEFEIVDLQLSTGYRRGHIPGASFALRSRLDRALRQFDADVTVVLTSDDGVIAHFAAQDLEGISDRPLFVLQGGNAEWAASGCDLTSRDPRYLNEPDDFWSNIWSKPDPEARFDEFRHHLDWETAVVPKAEQDPTVPFRIPRRRA